ncbi:MAG: hypothetical protein F7C32_04330 [Desulfurococcales archaeon]|nr:hypothetical protein [Desulfurococcales archaeon]
MSRVRRGQQVLPIEDILAKPVEIASKILDITKNHCSIEIVQRPGKIFVENIMTGDTYTVVVGRGSIVLPDKCLLDFPEVYLVARDEWLDTCKIDKVGYFGVTTGKSEGIVDGVMTSFTLKMIYPMTVNGFRAGRVQYLGLQRGDEVILGIDCKPEIPLIVYRGNELIVSNSLSWLIPLLQLESRCSHYKFLST